MKFIAIFLISCTNLFTLYSQNREPCFFDTYKKLHTRALSRAESKIQIKINAKKDKERTSGVRIIPTVVHVIQNGGSENISDAQIQSQIQVINEDFRKITGSKGDGKGVDTGIEFRLAKLTPDGKCTNGIVRIKSSYSNHQTYQRSNLKELSFWNNRNYLNIYVVKNINNGSGILGYASFPGGPEDEDGIVIRHDYFGKEGTANGKLGRTATHEIGHWLGLFHTFNGGCGIDVCLDGDYVCDTPPASNPNYGCPSNRNSCTIEDPDELDQIENYMDYSDDFCKNTFTRGQSDRMHASLDTIRNEIWSEDNLISTGLDTNFVNSPCNVIADFTTLSSQICLGNKIEFINKTLNGATNYYWTFYGGDPLNSDEINPLVTYNSIGNFDAKLISTGPFGKDSLTLLNFIQVNQPLIGQAPPFYEGFEKAITDSLKVLILNPDLGITWEIDSVAINPEGKYSIRINNLINTNYGQSDALLLPDLDLSSLNNVPSLQFKWAYARSDVNYSDELIVLSSKDCGTTWQQIFYRTGSQLATGPTQTSLYIPDSNTVWKTANIALSSLKGYSNVKIKIVNVTDGGNCLYIDNIEIKDGINGLEKDESIINYILTPNPNRGVFSLEGNFALEKNVSVKIYNLTGKEVSYTYRAENSTKKIFELRESVPGIYILQILLKDKAITQKIIVY